MTMRASSDSLRIAWEFPYTASALAEAAKDKANAHEARLTWWEAKKDEVMKKVRETGIEIHDSVAASYSNTKGNFGPQITIDDTMQRDLSECQMKIMEHTAMVKEYGGWHQVLAAQPETRELRLTREDWLFFFSK